MQPTATLEGRRDFIKKFASASAGVSAALVANSAIQIKQSGDLAKEEIEQLKNAYAELDKKTKLMVRGMFVLLGVDFLLLL
ncbi:hypothetical protein N9M08_02730 [Porticoccaceae bacterium]|jgi:hypothetical protein|nr:hypothetical protein [Porticoccaceae bacterium]MDB2634013.1 hypothetical protein [Porticoccaceae bacterium]MDB2664254.1 hypothetical protein [Porticoccaceae bacterium]MDC0494570.1 hypothetical protein [bacterium]